MRTMPFVGLPGVALAVLVLLATPAAGAPSALTWESGRIEVDAAWDAERVEAVFRCANGGDRPVTITDARAGCGCIATRTTPGPIAPGATGEVAVVLSVGHQSGRVTRQVTVRTDEVGEPTLLTLVARVPRLGTLKPGSLTWRVGDEPIARTARVELDASLPIAVRSVGGATALLDVQWRPDAPAATAGTITVVPRHAERPWEAVVVVRLANGRELLLMCRCRAPDRPADATAAASPVDGRTP